MMDDCSMVIVIAPIVLNAIIGKMDMDMEIVLNEKFKKKVADFYRSYDIYIHAAKMDTFPNTILEVLACGIPAIATTTSVGGIQEQIDGFERFYDVDKNNNEN